MTRAFALVVAVEDYAPASGLASLDRTVSHAYGFVGWLLNVRGADPRDIFLCASPKPVRLPPEIQKGVRTFRATRAGIRSAATQLVHWGADKNADVFVYLSGHGGRFDGSDVLMASDYRSHDGDKCIRLDELQKKLLPALGPGTHYWFVEACRNEVDFPIGGLALNLRTSYKGRGTPNNLFATAPGATARAQSKFAEALLSSLHGGGRAKTWFEGSYWVTFPVVAEVVRDAVQPEGTDVDAQPAWIPGRILQLAAVPDVTVSVDIRGARDGERYLLVLGGDRPPVSHWLTWPEQRVDVPPGRYYVSLLRDATEKTEVVSHPRDTAIAIYEPILLEFDRNKPAGPPDPGFTVVGPSASTGRLRVAQSTGDTWLGAGTRAGYFTRLHGPLSIKLFDRDEPVVSVEYTGQRDLYSDEFLRRQFALSGLSGRVPAEATVIDPDPALKLSLLAAAAIGDIYPYAPAIAGLPKFDSLTRTQASVYAMTPPGGGVMTVHSDMTAHNDLQSARLTLVEGLRPASCYAAVLAEPTEPHRVHLQIPGADMVIPTVAIAGRVTVIVVQQVPDSSSQRQRWRVHQFALTPGHLAANDPATFLAAVQFSVLVQRRIDQGRPAMAAEPDPENAQLWAQLLEGRWPDPLTMLLAAYELVRRGALGGADRDVLLNLIGTLGEYGEAFAADLAVLDALAAGHKPRSGGEPLALDGLIALGGEEAISGPEGMALDYRGAWTRWRAWPSGQQVRGLGTGGHVDAESRSVPKPVFTDAEAGAKEFPDSDARRFNYYTPQKRKQTHYEDVTVEVQPDPRHYLAQGWLYGFADGRGGYPLDWTVLKAWGSDRPEPERYPGSGGKGYDWPAHGWHEFRDPNEEWELTFYRYNSNVVRQLNQNIDVARETRAFDQWTRNWINFVERNVGAWMHVDHGLGLYLFGNANRRGPTNMHNTAMVVNSMHRIRAAQDLALYNLTLTEEIEGFDGAAHLATWNEDPSWQETRKLAEALTGIWDWAEAIFAANVIFEPLVGEPFRSSLVMHAAPRNGDFVTPTIVGVEEYDYGERDLRYTRALFHLLTTDREFADHNKGIIQGWLSTWVPQAIAAARAMQPLWSQPEAKPPRFEDSLDNAKARLAGILSDLDLEAPKELNQ